jgi:hypothetical protein
MHVTRKEVTANGCAGGCIHLFFEGYFAYNFRRMGGMQGVLSLGLTLLDPGRVCALHGEHHCRMSPPPLYSVRAVLIGSLQIFWGPMSFMTAGLIAVDHPLRYPFQIIVSLGQLYGDVLYYATSMFDHYILDLSYSRPEAAYFWGYFVLMNAYGAGEGGEGDEGKRVQRGDQVERSQRICEEEALKRGNGKVTRLGT